MVFMAGLADEVRNSGMESFFPDGDVNRGLCVACGIVAGQPRRAATPNDYVQEDHGGVPSRDFRTEGMPEKSADKDWGPLTARNSERGRPGKFVPGSGSPQGLALPPPRTRPMREVEWGHSAAEELGLR
jgi:hypothetical protein